MQICSPFGQGGSTQLEAGSTLCLETKRGVHGLEPDQSLLCDWNQGGGKCRSALRLAKGVVHSFDSLLGDQEGGTRLGAGPNSALRLEPRGGYMQISSPFGQGGSTQLRLSAWRPRGGYTAWSRTNLCSLIGTKGAVHADQLSVWPRGGVHSL